MNDFPKENLGVIEGVRPTDFVAGALPYEERLPSGDWRPYLVKEEHQYSDNIDTMACVSFSLNNSLEIQNKFLTGEEVNFSDRFLAKMSNTTPQGNWLNVVADTARNIGLVTEDLWPAPPNYTWNSYYSSIPQEVINKAQKFDISYEWIPTDLASLTKHLKQAPLQIVVPVPYPNHAVVLVHLEGETAYYFDTYSPHLKTMNFTYISSGLKVILKKGKSMQLINDNGTVYLVAGDKVKRITGIANTEVLSELFGDELIVAGKIPAPATRVLADGFIIHKV